LKKNDSYNEFIVDDIMLIDTGMSNSLQLDINSDLCADMQERVKVIFYKHYTNAVRPIEKKFQYEMEVKLTKDHAPIYFQPRRMSYSDKEKLKVIIDELLTNKIIRPSFSPYCSPILLDKKKNGNLRLCVDFRELNKVTIKDRFPLPLIDDHLDMLKDKKYFTRLDLKNAFYHVKVHNDSVKYLSFVTPMGQFEYTCMPFGFCNSPAIFMRYINNIFHSLVNSNKILIYLDDILISTETIDENISILIEVFDFMIENHLQLRLDKCSFLQTKIHYLGYEISHKGITHNPDNVNAIHSFPIPKNVKEVHIFLGLASYFRRFVKNFSIIAKPLYDLLKKKSRLCFWGGSTVKI